MTDSRPDTTTRRYDYVVVGAGSAGCALAARLSEDPALRVLLLEAGPPGRRREIRIPAAFPSLFRSECDWAFESEPEAALGDRRLFLPQGRTVGGTSSINAQIYLRGHRADFDGWAAAGATGWSWEEVLPYFRRAERHERGADAFRGGDGPLWISDPREANPITHALVRAAVEAGLPRTDDLNGAQPEGVSILQATQRRGRRWSAADAYLRPARRRANLEIVTGGRVLRITVEGRRANGVEYLIDGFRQAAGTERDVILCAGAIGSPQVLMLSGIGPAEHLRDLGIDVVHHLPGVGQNLQDHPMVPVLHRSPLPVTMHGARSRRQIARYLLRRRGLLATSGGEAAAVLRSHPSLEAPDVEIAFGLALLVDGGLEPPPEHGFSMLAAALAPRSRGHVTLRTRDPLSAPAIALNLLSDPADDDMRALISGVRMARRIAATSSARAVSAGEIEPGASIRSEAELESWIRRRAQSFFHLAGTCRLGQDALAVVDPQLRVHGVEGLRVADASVMPLLVRGHTHAAAVMIGERAADLIRWTPTDQRRLTSCMSSSAASSS